MSSVASLLTLTINALLTLIVKPAMSAYTQVAAHYTPANFFDEFDFFTGSDPTNGFVQYVPNFSTLLFKYRLINGVIYRYIDRKSAQDQGIIRNEGHSVYVGVDHWSYTSTGRQSVRLDSKQRFMRGLFVLDMQHMPSSTCGIWSALYASLSMAN